MIEDFYQFSGGCWINGRMYFLTQNDNDFVLKPVLTWDDAFNEKLWGKTEFPKIKK